MCHYSNSYSDFSDETDGRHIPRLPKEVRLVLQRKGERREAYRQGQKPAVPEERDANTNLSQQPLS